MALGGAALGFVTGVTLPLRVLADGGHGVAPLVAPMPVVVGPESRPSFAEHNLDADIGHFFHFLIAHEGKVVDLDVRLAVEGSRNGSNHNLHRNNPHAVPNHNAPALDWIVMSYTRRNLQARLLVFHPRVRNLPPGYFAFHGPFEVQNEYAFEFADFDINRLPKGYKGFYLSPAGYTAPR